MAIVRDAASLGPMEDDNAINNADVFMIAQRLGVEANAALYELDEYEAISMVFLLLDVECLARYGFRYCQYIASGRAKFQETMDNLVTIVQRNYGHLTVIIEALYIIGRYDLLEDRLRLAVNQNFRTVFSGHLENDKKALYFVFAGMAQEEADRIIRSRLSNWFCPEFGRPLEETFARNLNIENYQDLVTNLYNGLMEENKEVLAMYLRPFIRQVQPPTPPTSAMLPTSWNEDTFYPGPSCYPHGLCIIINVKSFMKPRDMHDNIPLPGRHGSDIDKERLTGTFKLFGFHVMHFDNPDFEMIQQFFKSLRLSPKLAVASCLAVCVMSHGDEKDQIYLHDRSCISITDLRKLCFSQALINKPRLYFVQACRGERALQPIFLKQDMYSVTHMESDCLISAATVKGYSAVRSQTEGSWYITDLCQALQEYGHIYPIKTVLQKTRQTLKARVGNMLNSYVTQLSEEKDTLVKDVQFVRADEEHFVEGILDLVHLETLEEILDEVLEEAMQEAEREGSLESIIEKFAEMAMSQDD